MDKVTKNPITNAKTRRQTYIIPKRSIVQRYPLTFIWTCTISGLLVFFSRPLYDAFLRTDNPEPPPPPGQLRETIQKAWRI